MLALVSPAKKMNFDEIKRPLVYTDPDIFSAQSENTFRKLNLWTAQKVFFAPCEI